VHRKAIIDLGTNTFNLLIADIADDRFNVVYSEKEGVALGMGGINERCIANDAFERGINTLKRFKKICNTHETIDIRAIGTSALRDASNSAEFINQAWDQIGLKIEIISGDQEAEYIYRGVSWSYDFPERAVIMDIGGGSTEFVFADVNGIIEKRSFDIGVSRIFQEFTLADPLTEENIAAIETWLDKRTNYFFDNKSCSVLIGASGSFETFHEMIHETKFLENFLAMEIPQQELEIIMDWVIYSTQSERDQHPYIIQIRRKMAPIAAVKTKWVMRKMGITKTYVTPCSLKEGVLRG